MQELVLTSIITLISLLCGIFLSWKTPSPQKIFVILCRVGFFGISFTLPFVFYEPTLLVSLYCVLTFTAFTIFGLMGCFKLNTHPLFPAFPIFSPKKVSYKHAAAINTHLQTNIPVQTHIIQTVEESTKLLDSQLAHIKHPQKLLKNISFRNHGELYTFPYTVFSPAGIFILFQCNWGGHVSFDNNSAQKANPSYHDTPDATTSLFQRVKLIQSIIRKIGFSLPIIPIMITTNSSINAEMKTELYQVLSHTQLLDYIQSQEPVLNETDLQDFYSGITPYISLPK
ncbi:hypothetical protein [Bacillus cereus]|uniref:NERD domain-containing protein n=1 Tax=Bacillus cereus TaxID=1396 RepID=A0A164QSJ0_BACCE|nr:hypothetical protein [Bacillus cereus]KZD72120.1 hypothetical protein B4088_0581 [Bacillus cereus]